jgi:hypothetical protein
MPYTDHEQEIEALAKDLRESNFGRGSHIVMRYDGDERWMFEQQVQMAKLGLMLEISTILSRIAERVERV